MKRIYRFCVFLMLIVLVSSCATKVSFPVSNIVPAADISAKKKTDNNKNFTLEITAKNLASPDRLSPPGNNYSVWVVTNEYGIKNVGQLILDNAEKSTFETVSPFNFNEVFITVEDQGDLKYPTGREITRVKI